MTEFEVPKPNEVKPVGSLNLQHPNFLLRAVAVGSFLIVGAFLVLGSQKTNPPVTTSTPNSTGSDTTSGLTSFKFDPQKKSLHFVTSTPAHESVLAAVPINIVIDFNFDLGSKSVVTVANSGKEYTTGLTTVDSGKLTLRRPFDPTAPDGFYVVKYSACWPDNTCHDGQFQFVIDRTKAASFNDQRGKSEVTVNIKDIAFNPASLRVSRGTKVSWVNSDSVGHYVNTDSHPAHSYFDSQNSKLINTGEKHSLTFNQVGVFPYHCSAHTQMTANIIVE